MRFKRRLRQLVGLGLVLLVLPTSLMAAPIVKRPLAPPDTSSPQATLISFVENINRAHQLLMDSYDQYQQESGVFPSTSVRQQFEQVEILFERAKRTLNLSKIPPRLKQDTGTEGVLMLKEILDRIELPPYTEIPDTEAVATDQDLFRWTIPDTEIHIVKVESGPRAGEFLFSIATVARLEEFYRKVKRLPYKPGASQGVYQFYISTPGSLIPSRINIWFQNLPSWLNVFYWHQTLWQWISLGISLLIAFWIPYQSFRYISPKVAALGSPQRNWSRLLSPIIAIASLALVSYFLDEWINITGQLLVIMLTTMEIIFWILLALTLLLFSNAVAESIIASRRINLQDLNVSLLRTVFRLLGLSIGVTILIVGIERVGISLIPILAGLGIGGLALALAARPTLQNIIAGLLLFADRPVRVGDFCRFGDKIGTVEEIGLRSTHIRSLERTVISVPNADFSQRELENYSRRDRILLRKIISLRYETTPEQMRFVLAKLREMLLAHPRILEERARVRFLNYGEYSFDVEIFVDVDTTDWSEFLAIQEDVLLRVIDIVAVAGTGFAFPSQRNYLSQDRGLDPERSRAAEVEVQAWRSKGILPFPDLPSEQRQQLRDTLDFPPEGSPNARPDLGNGENDQE